MENQAKNRPGVPLVPEPGGAGPARPAESAGRRRIELTVPQVAGSAAAAVTGAFLASGMGVYGTVVGAGLISVVATAGGAVYQHLFDRTGHQLRNAATVRPRRVPRPPADTGSGETAAALPAPAPLAEPGRGGGPESGGGAVTEYGTPRRRRVLRRRAALAGGVFLLAMGAVTGIEILAGSSLSGWWHGDDRGGTSVSDLFRGSSSASQEPAEPEAPASGGAGTTEEEPPPGADPEDTDPEDTGGPDGGAAPDPAPTPGEQESPDSSGGASEDGDAGQEEGQEDGAPPQQPDAPDGGGTPEQGDGTSGSGESEGAAGTQDSSGAAAPDGASPSAAPEAAAGAGGGVGQWM